MSFSNQFLKLFIFVSIFSISCSKSEISEARNEIFFNVDSNLIQKVIEFSEIGIKIAPPKGWVVLPSSELTTKIRIDEETGRRQTDSMLIKSVFFDSSSKSFLIISQISVGKSFEAYIDSLDSLFSAMFDSFTFQKANFRKGKISITQYLTQNEQIVNFRFLGLNLSNSVFQIDFVIPKAAYSTELAKVVESSLGTLEFIY
ncbi:MAG: hypothetical protein N2517_04540 [Ignavibacteria bacterium]|nr:hypothetical protein [Ignavibacteria bacterium]